MKAILISINPRYVKDILNGIKPIEIRKSTPKCDLPIDVYIYCTKRNYLGYLSNRYVGKVVAKFTLMKVDPFYYFEDDLCEQACLTREEMLGYLGDKTGYAWHIANLEIFNKPKEINEFKYYKKFSEIDYMLPIPRKETCKRLVPLTRVPQSWQFIEI